MAKNTSSSSKSVATKSAPASTGGFFSSLASLFTGGSTKPAQAAPSRAAAPPRAATPASTSNLSNYAKAIQAIESRGSGGYNALGPVTKKGDRAYGAYQVMGSNIPSWTKEVLGRPLTPQQFLADPKIQDSVFNAKFGQSVQKFGNPQDAASVWFTGRPLSKGGSSRDILGTSGNEYVNKFTALLGKAPAATAPTIAPSTIGMSAQPQSIASLYANPGAGSTPGGLSPWMTRGNDNSGPFSNFTSSATELAMSLEQQRLARKKKLEEEQAAAEAQRTALFSPQSTGFRV